MTGGLKTEVAQRDLMERRFYFIFGDALACACTGAVGGWLAHAAVPGDLSTFFAMFIGMFLGMTAGMLAAFVFAPLFGAMEIMLPTSLAGMVAGMIVGMGHMFGITGPETAAWVGAMAGIVSLLFTYILQARLVGEVE